MTNKDLLEDGPVNAGPPALPKPGYATTSGQFTGIFTLVALILSLIGYHYSPTQIENWAQMAENFIKVLGPIIAIVPVLITYINSRGKIASNAIVTANTPPAITAVGGTIAELVDRDPFQFAGVGGLDFKNPKTYESLLHIAGELGVPGAHQADTVAQKVPIGDLITGILGALHHKTK
jgi:hypothetical protein